MTIKQAYDYAKAFLSNCINDSVVFEAKQLIMKVTGLTATDIIVKYNEPLSQNQFDNLTDMLIRRRNGEPLQYIFGSWEFYGMEFAVGSGVLIPRAETELLVEQVLKFIGQKNVNVIDLCSGSGCIAAAIAKNAPGALVSALEKFDTALKYLRQNTKDLSSNVQIIEADLFDYCPDTKFDVIVSNPPYIRSDEIKNLEKSVSFEPVTALDGGDDGLKFYRELTGRWCEYLKKGGMLITEIGYDQGKSVVELFTKAGLTQVKLINDYSGLNRIVCGINE